MNIFRSVNPEEETKCEYQIVTPAWTYLVNKETFLACQEFIATSDVPFFAFWDDPLTNATVLPRSAIVALTVINDEELLEKIKRFFDPKSINVKPEKAASEA